ncbi:CPBP family glutamic-type intramembrane protease [Mucilaginibacter xinganensis]|uniref:CPBP family intramembrane metalloprotease n=1 Tax=Mucilaginibacter xinganensis TaxID=1234841 RepID=A0A223NUQ7_9SPHI|nr:CPBP family glutamic-type intramembrane protease [Mucilaginibacter xinganensis]ASU33490.1 CPBP family intramembrane metalloprotease [Mucilaginibacter xinganensis]
MFKELLAVNEYPNLLQQPNAAFTAKLWLLLKIYGVLFLAILFIAPLIIAADNFVVHVLHFKTINKVQHDSMRHFFQKLGYWKAFFYVGLLGPLLEETIFRLPLSLKKRDIAFAFSAAAFLFDSFLFKHISSPMLNIGIRLSISAIIYLACIFNIPNGLSIVDYRFRNQLIILSMCLFGLMHIANYSPIQWPVIWIYPVYVLPQLLMGWAITFVRFKNGFFWGFALHCIINMVSVMLSAGRI